MKYSFDINDISNVVGKIDIDYLIIEHEKEFLFKNVKMYKNVYASDVNKVIGNEKFIIYKVSKDD